ncbi:MAG: hypothetical protein JXA13_08305 [Anaerolineales bacterium]|nr:hypothetical protein [Anaerolineales bacterium]
MHHTSNKMGRIAFLGSGETSYAGGRIFETLAKEIPGLLRVAVLETPAGFELNSAQVAGRVAEYLAARLQNYNPQIDVVPARKLGGAFSPDDPQILAPLMNANLIFMGPGSPTYAVRQLQGSLAWELLRARHRLGAALVFSSAAAISVGASVLPVYEIFKAGEDVHYRPGLDLFSSFNLPLTFVPHWNNTEGGADLDTSRCFLGLERFDEWRVQLPPDQVLIGLDEHTGLVWHMAAGVCTVSGVGSVTVIKRDCEEVYPDGSRFDIQTLGDCCAWPEPREDIPDKVWELLSEHAVSPDDSTPPAEILALVEARRQARSDRDWGKSDQLRDRIAGQGWLVQDTPEGQKLVKA